MLHGLQRLIAGTGFVVLSTIAALAADDPLPSWNDGASKQAIVDFVGKVTDPSSPDFVSPGDRVATFDNDGTLWTEHPMYTQLAFALDRVKALAPQHPEWQDMEPFKSVLSGDVAGVAASGEKGLMELVGATHAGMTSAEFTATVTDWIATAKHPKFGKPYTELVYQPMLELIKYLKSNDFEVYIVSGGGIEFMRPWTGKVYGIPPQDVVGSSIQAKFEMQDGKPVIMRLPDIAFIDDGAGKPIGIYTHIGKQPIASFGNSGGDRQMLEWANANKGATLQMLVFHDDATREYAYGPAEGLPDTKFGAFPQSLMDEAKAKGWVVISMKDDWKQIFPAGN